MSKSGAQQKRDNSRACSEDVLLEIGFSRVGSSSLYKKGTETLILSPGISQGKHERYWFDIRDVNLKKMNNSSKAWVLLRIVPEWFALFSIDSIQEHINKKTQDIRKNSGVVYGFYCELNEKNRLIKITAKNDKSAASSLALLDRQEAKQALNEAMEI